MTQFSIDTIVRRPETAVPPIGRRLSSVVFAFFAVFPTVTTFANDEGDREAAVIFDGKKLEDMAGGTWKVVYSSAEGPEGRALETLTERIGFHILRERHLSTSMVLPLERDGDCPVPGKRDSIVMGVPSENATLRRLMEESRSGDVPPNGYLISTFNKDDRNYVLLAGDTSAAVLWATFDFLDVVVPSLEQKLVDDVRGLYAGTFFRANRRGAKRHDKESEKPIPVCKVRREPETLVRSIFSWGHVVDDCRTTFREMARARFNRAILWNDQKVVNAREVVECAHSWGVEVFWGFSWGWTLSGSCRTDIDFGKIADNIVNEWRRVWKPMGGDGIYFQSFTETGKSEISGRSIPEAVTELVNAVAKRIHEEAPDLKIVFGLHSNSMRTPGAAEAIAKVDPSLEILWENCGGFPFGTFNQKKMEPDVEFCDKILALNPSVGLAWKGQLSLDWGNYAPPAGPFLLGCAGRRMLERDQAIIEPIHWQWDEAWLKWGKTVWEFTRHIRASKHPPKELNAVAEYNPPYSFATHCHGELFWSSKDTWEEIAKRARMRARPER